MGKIQIDALSEMSAKRHKIPRKGDATSVTTQPDIPLLQIPSDASQWRFANRERGDRRSSFDVSYTQTYTAQQLTEQLR